MPLRKMWLRKHVFKRWQKWLNAACGLTPHQIPQLLLCRMCSRAHRCARRYMHYVSALTHNSKDFWSAARLSLVPALLHSRKYERWLPLVRKPPPPSPPTTTPTTTSPTKHHCCTRERPMCSGKCPPCGDPLFSEGSSRLRPDLVCWALLFPTTLLPFFEPLQP